MLKSGRSDEEKASCLQKAIKVMVVENNKVLLAYVGDSLKSHSFEVTCIDQAGVALKILTKGDEKFDLLFIGGELQDVDAASFLRVTKNMNIPSMVMHEEADDNFVFKMISCGALLVVKRPFADDVFLCARQWVIKERLRKLDEVESDRPAVGKKAVAVRSTERNSNAELHENGDMCVKLSVEWTKELHSLFLRAACKLAKEGRSTPKNILVEMGVPELTRAQVASHLQKYRSRGWKLSGNNAFSKSTSVGSSNGSKTKDCNRNQETIDCPRNVVEKLWFPKHRKAF